MMFNDIKQTIICASKYFNHQEMRKIHHMGIRDFGENKAQDLLAKIDVLKDLNITWHFIGHLQTNKVKDIINHIDVLHTLDRIRLADVIQKHRIKPLPCFIQVNMTNEPQKSGILVDNLLEFLEEIKKYDKINIIGLMTMGMLNHQDETKKAFEGLKKLAEAHHLKYTSMGMSDDYDLAIQAGATHLRLGSYFKSLI